MCLWLHLYCRARAATLQQPPCSQPAVAATPPHSLSNPTFLRSKPLATQSTTAVPWGTPRHSPGDSSDWPGLGPCRAARCSSERDMRQQTERGAPRSAEAVLWPSSQESLPLPPGRLAARGPRTMNRVGPPQEATCSHPGASRPHCPQAWPTGRPVDLRAGAEPREPLEAESAHKSSD